VALMSDSGIELQLNQIEYADDTALVADDKCNLQRRLVSEFERVCEHSVARWIRMRHISNKSYADERRIETI
jgi:hypothetical protein